MNLFHKISFQGFVWVDWMKKCMRKWHNREDLIWIVWKLLPAIVFPILKFGDSLAKLNTLILFLELPDVEEVLFDILEN